MNYTQANSIEEWIADVDLKYLTPGQAFYIKNREFFLNIHGNLTTSKKNSSAPANYQACQIQFPAGENYSAGTYSTPTTDEIYIIIYNSNQVNFIYRMNRTGCQIVYDEPCLSVSDEPRHEITQGRIWLHVKKTCKNWAGKQLIWTDGRSMYCLDVEASIVTNSFTTPFFDTCTDPCDLISLCVPAPIGCLVASYLPRTTADALLSNKIVDIGFQFMYRYVYYDGRRSTWSKPSTFYYQDTTGCFQTADGASRCMSLRIPVGNAMVAFIELAYRNDNGPQWYLVERIAKYKQYNNAQQQWYQRDLAEIIATQWNGVVPADCSFDYKFCNDKQCDAIDPADSDRVFNPFPREAQCFIPFKEGIAVMNYKKGSCPLPKSIGDNLLITASAAGSSNCQEEYATVTVRAVIHDFWHDRGQFIYVENNNPDTEINWFGGLNDKYSGGFEQGWGQQFSGKTKNFIAYVEGAEGYYAEMKQHKRDSGGLGPETEVGTLTGMATKSKRNAQRDFLRAGGYYVQVAKIKVRKGTKGFIRLSNHAAQTVDTNSSTYVRGLYNLAGYNGNKDIGGVETTTIDKSEEIYFDTCLGDQDITDRAFVIRDNAIDGGFRDKAAAICGYVRDAAGNPLEGLKVQLMEPVTPNSHTDKTDHNGFYHLLSVDGFSSTVPIKVYGELDCGNFDEIKSQDAYLEIGTMARQDITITNTAYLDNSYGKVFVTVNDCNGMPIPGIVVAMSGSKAQTTVTTGEAVFKVRQYETRARLLRAIVMDKNGCFEQDCAGNCNLCMPSVSGTLPSCTITKPTTNLGIMPLNIDYLKHRTFLKPGGRFNFGVIAEGGCGELSFVNKGLPLDIPKRCSGVNTVGTLGYNFSGMNFASTPWVKSISIVRTKNLNPFELQWVVDKAEYVGGKIKLTIQSLNDYNYNHSFKTNTIYQYLDGDRVEFVSDENNKFYCNSLNYRVLSPFHDTVKSGKTDAPADYFNQILIEDDGRIGKNIEPGTIIELQRPKDCETIPAYHTICAQLDVVNGLVVNPVGTFTTFDTYRVNRKIGDTPAKEFDHHSPSDFWGTRVTDIGSAHIVNEFEDEIRKDRNITISDLDDLNAFGSLEKTIGDAQMGGITSAHISDDKIILVICERDNFLAQTADDLLRVTADGTVQAVSGDQAISNPQAKISGKYGCQYDDIGSILFGDGWATWADVNNNAYVMHDYNEARAVSDEKISTWTNKRFQAKEVWNAAQTAGITKYRFSTGINAANDIVHLTLKRWRDSGIDNALEPWQSENETITFRPADKKFYGHKSFTPEAYGRINIYNGVGAAFVTINHGQAWVHPIQGTKWGEYYGVPVDQVVGLSVINKFPEKIKRALNIEIQDDIMWYAYKVITDRVNFDSEIPPVYFKSMHPGKWSAPFLFNKNAPGGLFGNKENFAGENTRGYVISVIFVRNNTDQLKYGVIDNANRILYDELDMISCKFSLIEQSGFTENV